MTTPKPITKHNHPAPAWVWTETEERWIAERDAAWQAAMAAAVAAEREECAKVCEAKVGDKPADPAFGDARDAADYTEWEALTKAAAAIRSRGKA